MITFAPQGYSPPPWAPSRRVSAEGGYLILSRPPGRSEQLIATTYRDEGVTLAQEAANAALLAASPALFLAALEAAADLAILTTDHPPRCECSACRSLAGLRRAVVAATTPPGVAEVLPAPAMVEGPPTLPVIVAGLPPTLGEFLTRVVTERDNAVREAELARQEAALAHWQALAGVIREDLGQSEGGIELLRLAQPFGGLPEGWTPETDSYQLNIALPGLALLRVTYRCQTLHNVDGTGRRESSWRREPGWRVLVRPGVHETDCPTLANALLTAFDGREQYALFLAEQEMPF